MILFNSDWKRYPDAIADYQTSNHSFLRMASLYRDMGIKNALFPLALHQPDLQGVDPYSPNLDEDTKFKIGVECKYNIWYYLREVVRIPPVAGPNPVPYRANRGNLALTWMFMTNTDFVLIQPRQTGKSVGVDCLMDWVIYIGASNTEINMITKDHTLRTSNVERLKKIRDLLPEYLVDLSSRDSDNYTGLSCRALNNLYTTAVGQTSESSANKLGRGLTSPITHIDEAPFIRFIGTTLPAALASGVAARQEARMYGRPYGNIFTTTAGKKDDRDGYYVYDLVHGGAVWSELFLDSRNKEELETLVSKNCMGRKILVNGTFSHRQLGYTDEWLYKTMSEVGAVGEEADRDFFNIWTSGTQKSPLHPDVNDAILRSELDPVENEISSDSYIMRWYVTPEEYQEMMDSGVSLIGGLDTSDAIGRDSIALTIINSRDLGTVAAATINETNLIRFAKFLADLLIRIPNMVLVPERKSSGQAIIDSLVIHLHAAGIDPFRRIYNSVVDNHSEKPADYQEIQTALSRRNTSFYDRLKKTFGFNTTGASRDLLYGTVLQNAAKEAGHLVKDRVLSKEILGLVEKNGRIDHSSSSHDDMVISWMLAHWFLRHSKNLAYYGIDISQALIGVHTKGRELTVEEEYELHWQRKLREDIEAIYEELSHTNDEFMISRLESRLMSLSSQVKDDDSEALSIDTLIEQAAERREHINRQRQAEQRRKQGTGGRAAAVRYRR